MKVKFKKLRENAKLPTKAHDDDFCYDVYACDCEEVAPNVYRYPLGFALQIDENEGINLPDSHFQCFRQFILTIKRICRLIFAQGVQSIRPEWYSAIANQRLIWGILEKFYYVFTM